MIAVIEGELFGLNGATAWVVAGGVVGAVFLRLMEEVRKRCPRPTWLGTCLWVFAQGYLRVVHRVRYEGLEFVPKGDRPGPLIVVANHTSGVDPALIQCAVPVEIRWTMMRSMNKGFVRFFSWYLRVIQLEQDGRDFASMREAMRHLKQGGVIGVYPEGGIERPAGVLRPFLPGVGFLVMKSGAGVLPVWISGTPETANAMTTLVIPSRARVVFGRVMRFDGERDAGAVAVKIRVELKRMSGWETSEERAY